MIPVYFLIIVFFIWYAKKDFKKSLILFAAVYSLFNPGMAIRFQPPAITINLVLTFFFVVAYYIKYRKTFKDSERSFFQKSFLWMIVSTIVSAIVAILNGDTSALTQGARVILSEYVFIFVFWNTCTTKQDLQFFTKCILTVFCVVFAYGIFEYITNSNPILDIIRVNIPDAYSDDKLYISDLENINRDGRARYQSLFYITILYGISSILFAFYVITIYRNQKDFILKKRFLLLLVLLSFYACYVSNSKTPIIAVPILFMPFLLKKTYLFLLWILLPIILVHPEMFNNVIGNVVKLEAFDVNNNDFSDGSNIAMRLRQLNISFTAFLNAPIWGNGLKYSSYLASTAKGAELLGAESCWFKLLIEQGAFGLIAFVYNIHTFVKNGFEISKSDGRSLGFFALGFFVIVSITDIGYSLFYVLFIAMYKILRFNNANLICYDYTFTCSNFNK